MKKLSRKLLGIMLAVSMTVAAVFPVQSVAAGNGGSGYADTEEEGIPKDSQKPSQETEAAEEKETEVLEEDENLSDEKEEPEVLEEEEKIPEEENVSDEKEEPEALEEEEQLLEEEKAPEEEPGAETAEEDKQISKDTEEEASEEEKEPEETEEGKQPVEDGKETEEEPNKDQQDPRIQEQQPPKEQEKEQPAAEAEPVREQPKEETAPRDRAKQKSSAQSQDGEGENILPLEGSYDINQPVIEKFEFVENGQTLTREDTVHFNMYVYDADSDIRSITVEMHNFSQYRMETLEFVKGSEKNLYTAVLPCEQLSLGDYVVTSIRIEDLKNNYVDGEIYGDDGQYLYRFTIENKVEQGTVTLSDIQMKTNASNEDGTLKAGDTVTFTAKVQCDGETVRYGNMVVAYSGGYYDRESFYADYDAGTETVSGTFEVEETTYPEEWALDQIRIFTESGNGFYFSMKDIAPEADLKFTVNQEYDKDKPIVESIDIGENGRTVQSGETIDIKIKVNEEHPYVWANMEFTLDDPERSGREYVRLEYDENTQTYTGKIEITSCTKYGKWKLSYLRVRDTYDNDTYLRDLEAEGKDTSQYYMVSPDGYDDDKPVIKSISLNSNGREVSAGSTLTIKVEVEEENPSYDQAYAQFELQDDGSYTSYECPTLRYNEDARAYTGQVKIETYSNPGKWKLTDLKITDKNGNATSLSDYNETDLGGPWHYIVTPDGYDVEGPEIERITIDKNGEWVRPGDTITIRIKVKEKNPSPTGEVCFHPQASYVSAATSVDVTYDSSTQEYIGAIQITEDTYPCEWALTYIDLKDQYRNWYHMAEELAGWSYTYPWYYKVKSGNTYREDMKDVEFTFYGYTKQADGSYDLGYTYQTVENVGKRASLKELGVFPQPIQGVTATWKYSGSGSEVKEDTKLPFYSADKMYCYLYASYDKGCANVSLTYMSKNDGKKTVMLPQFIERDATYQDVLDILQMPEDAVSDDFAELRLSYSNDSHNKNTKVEDVARISVEADYKACQATWNARYIGQDGEKASKTISQSCIEGTTVGEALARLEKPEDVLGMKGTGWALIGADVNDIMSKEMVSFDIVALYQGKTTLDVSYTYRAEDGKIAKDNKMMVLDGENLSDAEIQGEATGVFKSVEHLAGLRISEWRSAIDVNQETYKSIQFQAFYQNCVVVLKYPDETCQYVIVERNGSFTLPTENETYKDILWEGFEMGQTVIITEDREFLAASAVRWDGTKEEITGERLPESEIEKIKKQIENAEPGDSIVIDMKKATVVPKEVLEAIKGKSVDIVLDMGAYSWSIDGNDVNATNLKDIDLEVTIGTDTVPSSLVESIAEGQPATQLSLTHNGEFGFRADLTLNLGGEHSGSTGNLYYYDSSGKLIFRNAGQIGEDGKVSLSFSHASDYVVVICKNTDQNQEPDVNPDEKTEEDPDDNDIDQGEKEEDDIEDDEKIDDKDRTEDQENTKDQENTEDTQEDGTGELIAKAESDSGKTKPASSDSGKLKSPKTGEE